MSSRPHQTQPGERAVLGDGHEFVDKARRPLPLTVRGDQGLREGEVWMVEGRRLDFWSGERLKLGNTYEMRVDLQAHGGNVDLVVKILRVNLVRSTGVESGFLHQAVFRAKSAEDGRRFERVFWRLNPEHAPEPGVELRVHPRRKRVSGAGSSAGGDRPRPGVTSRPSVSSMASGGFYARRLLKPNRPPGSSVPPQRHWSTKSEDERVPLRVIAPPEDRARRVVPQIAEGSPPTVLVRFEVAEALRADLLLERDDAFLFMAPARDLEPMQRVMLLLQLPQGQFVRLEAQVWESTHRGCVLVARGLSPSLRANLRVALQS